MSPHSIVTKKMYKKISSVQGSSVLTVNFQGTSAILDLISHGGLFWFTEKKNYGIFVRHLGLNKIGDDQVFFFLEFWIVGFSNRKLYATTSNFSPKRKLSFLTDFFCLRAK